MKEIRLIRLTPRIYGSIKKPLHDHPDKLKELKEREKEAINKKERAKEQTSSLQSTLDECLEWLLPHPIDHPVAQRITSFIAEMMALDSSSAWQNFHKLSRMTL